MKKEKQYQQGISFGIVKSEKHSISNSAKSTTPGQVRGVRETIGLLYKPKTKRQY